MAFQLIVNFVELTAAARDMNKALEDYREATAEAKAAAEDLASKWEGSAKESFVADQENAYRWYCSLAEVVAAIVTEAFNTAKRYQESEERLRNLMKS